MTIASPLALDRAGVLDRFVRIRARTRALFDVLDDAMYFERPIALRNPVVFYEGHLPGFAVNTLIKKALGSRGIDADLERIFARGIDPESEATAVARGNPAWPSREVVRAYAEESDARIAEAIASADFDDGSGLAAEALWTILEHEEMHQETLAYMWHEVPYGRKHKPASYVTLPAAHLASAPPSGTVHVPAGTARLGTSPEDAPFAWDNEQPAHSVRVEAFDIDAGNVTNGQFLEFVEAGGYRDHRWWRPEDWDWVQDEAIAHPRFWEPVQGRWHWRGMFERVPLPSQWPVYVTWAEACAYARWGGGRLPTEAEFHRAAFGETDGSERAYPWGDAVSARPEGNFDFERWDPEPVGLRPKGVSAFGVHDLIGNGWEWTSTVFAPFAGFAPLRSYPEYSADFFDNDHFVMKGASPVTARALTRRGFRNWFRPRYPYVYATFRCVGRNAQGGRN